MPPSDASAAGVGRIRMGAEAVRAQLRRLLDKHRWRHFEARALFYDKGKLRPEAEGWFDRLARENFVLSGAFHEDPRRHAYNEGRRELALEIINGVGLSLERINQLNAQLRSEGDD
jgi:hypothetical protein